jgi:cytoskeleton protein RodZ
MSNEIAVDFTSLPEPANAHTESLGAWFAQVRAGLGADQRDVARHLMLNPSIIQAIENDDFARLGPPVFVRGYLSRYARLLNMPDHEVLERYREQIGIVSQAPPPLQVVHPLRRQTRTRDLRGLLYLALLIGIGWTAIQHLPDLDPGRLAILWSDERPSNTELTANNPLKATTQVQYPFQVKSVETTRSEMPAPSDPAPMASTSSGQPSTPSSAESTTGAAAPASASVVFTATQTPASAASAPSPSTSILSVSGVQSAVAAPATTFATQVEESPATPNAGGETRLLLEFSNDCWVEVKDAQGNVLTSQLMRANTTHTL